MRKLFYGAGVAAAFFVSTGLLMPWLISNNSLPLPIIVIGFVSLGVLWLLILDKPLRALYKSLWAVWSDIHD